MNISVVKAKELDPKIMKPTGAGPVVVNLVSAL